MRTHFSFKQQYKHIMKTSILFIISILPFLLLSCSSDEDPNLEPEEARYYVKYEVYMPLGSGFEATTSREIRFVSENGEQTITTSNESWEGTYGPLKKGTELYLSVEAKSGGIRTNIEYYVRLSVSRDKEPFVLKGEQRKKAVSSLSTSYTIDF